MLHHCIHWPQRGQGNLDGGIEEAKKYATAIETGGEVVRPYVGVGTLDLTEEYALWQNRITIPEGVESGVAILEVAEGSPADKAGLKKGDIVVKINDKEIGGNADFRYQVYKYEVGDTLKVTFYRNGIIKTANITLTKKTAE